MIPQHSSESNEHYTPLEVIEAARRVMGSIDLDPSSSALANRRVQATTYYDKQSDGLSREWSGNVFLNPPGGSLRKLDTDSEFEVAWKVDIRNRYKTKSQAVAWWRKLQDEGMAGNVEQAIFVGFTLEILASSQGSQRWPSIMKHPFCVPKGRLEFTDEWGEVGRNPTHSNVIVYCGHNVELFRSVFSEFGTVR